MAAGLQSGKAGHPQRLGFCHPRADDQAVGVSSSDAAWLRGPDATTLLDPRCRSREESPTRTKGERMVYGHVPLQRASGR